MKQCYSLSIKHKKGIRLNEVIHSCATLAFITVSFKFRRVIICS